MGIEALSRGAAHAVFVESHRSAARTLAGNLERLGIESDATLIEAPLERARPRLAPHAPFDLVLSDPPWKISGPATLVVARAVTGLLAAGARVLMGHPAAAPVESVEGLVRVDLRKWGGTGMSFFEIPRDSSMLARSTGDR
jgi:16S rRNA (guanine966-N2)-methyltransferase